MSDRLELAAAERGVLFPSARPERRPKAGAEGSARAKPRWKQQGTGISAAINVTPLVDVVLVLLIIFMVVTAAVEPGADVELPKIGQPDAASAKADPVTVSLSKDGQVWLEKSTVADQALREALRDVHTQSPNRKVVLKADRAVGYGKVRALFKECRDVGFPGVSLQVLERSKGS